ncbi:TrfB-related DNA-binding protein [Enterobacter hormaechei]|uniref:TrfB-related DNA-binding protein n=1 Tax=Enterobacter hormaechei TaxID=158836 RepID=UPI0020B8DB32|nr:TrfB-related DNA-binding protein [Enterobacter hormaechei]UTI09397.1 transcriptional regulator KorA [Enterobacter hormaechei subsp. steigerwaltii]
MALPKVSLETWKSLESALKNMQPKTKDFVYDVVVNGKDVSQIAKEEGLSRQTIYEAVWKFATILEKSQREKLVPVYVWLPEDLAEKVKKMAEPYQKKEEEN